MGKGAFWAAHILTPKERIERIEKLQKEFSPEAIQTGTIILSGTIVAEGEPSRVIDGEVAVHSQNQNSGYTTSCGFNNGEFSLSIPAGNINIAAYVNGYAPAYLTGLRGDKNIENLRLVVKKGFPAVIHVTDAEGKPLEGVKLEGGYEGNPVIWKFKLSTDPHGDANIDGVGSDPMEFRASIAGFQADKKTGICFEPDKPLDWAMQPAKPLRGRVVSSETGAPVPKAQISLLAGGLDNCMNNPYSAPVLTTADEHGDFGLDQLRNDASYTLQIKADGFRPAVRQNVTIQHSPLEIKLDAPLHIKGRVLLPKTDTMPQSIEIRCEQSVRVTFDGSHTIRQTQKAPVKDGIAVFEFKGVYAAETTIVSDAGRKSVKLPHFNQSVDDVILDLTTPGSTSQSVAKRWVGIRFDLPKGAPAPAGKIHVVNHVPNFDAHTEPVKNGEVWFEVDTPNELDVEPQGLIGYYFSPRRGEKIGPGSAPFEIHFPVLPAGSVHGEIFEADGSPAKGCFITLVETGSSARDNMSNLSLNTQIGDQNNTGTFVATPLPLGHTYAAIIGRGNTFTISPSVRVDEKTPIPDIRVVIPDGVTVRGRVVNEEGKPVPPMPFNFQYESPFQHGFGSNGNVVGDGRFVISHINFETSGTYRIALLPLAEYVPATIILDRNQPNPTVVLKKGRRLTGTAIDEATGLPLGRMRITAHTEKPVSPGAGLDPRYDSYEAESETDVQGRFRFSNLPPGRFTLRGDGANPADPNHPTIVESGQENPVLLKLKPLPNR
ncbi:MAG: carboxypeptidase regulatory-like domain-containing protein [Chthoniobacteraceae bacterium]